MPGTRVKGRKMCPTVSIGDVSHVGQRGSGPRERLETYRMVTLACGYERPDDLARLGRRLNCPHCDLHGHVPACVEANARATNRQNLVPFSPS